MIATHPPASAAAESAAVRARSRREEIESHVALVRTLARRFARRGEPLDDLVQAGCIGLIHAVDGYDPARGCSFEAYAVPTITGAIRRHLRDSSTAIRIPRRVREERARVYRARAQLEARKGRPPTAPEVAEAVRLPLPLVESALAPEHPEP